jgi:hypothetical protein
VTAVEGVDRGDVALDDYFASDEINAGVASAAGFMGSFGGEATTELDDLRLTFYRKAYTAALERVWQRLRRQGLGFEELPAVLLGDVADHPDGQRLLRRREALGLGTQPHEPMLVDDEGRTIPPAQVARWLRRAQTVRVNMEGNGELCRGLLNARYHLGELEERLSRLP